MRNLNDDSSFKPIAPTRVDAVKVGGTKKVKLKSNDDIMEMIDDIEGKVFKKADANEKEIMEKINKI